MPSLLDTLRQVTTVDCDTLDSDVVKSLGPFVDCTSNQAIAFFELSRLAPGNSLLHHGVLIKEAAQDAMGKLREIQGRLPTDEFIVEVMMVKLQLLSIPHLTGYVHVQTNPKHSYSTSGTIENAERIIAIFQSLAPELDTKRVCIKIPATWEGLQACRVLEAKGIATLATTMFSMVQAVLAADANCTYIAPYVNELNLHFEEGYVDTNKAFDFCREAQAYYTRHSCRTLLIAASLSSVDDVMKVAGIHHITISPALLHELDDRDDSTWDGTLGAYFAEGPTRKALDSTKYEKILADENAWKLAFTSSCCGTSERKIVQAINYFSDFQGKLEHLVKLYAY